MKAGWRSVELGDVIDLQSGFAFKSAEYTEKGHFLVRIANVQEGYVSLDKPKYVQLTEKTQRFALNEGDILTSLTGNIGRVAEVAAAHLPAALNQRVARITPKQDALVDRSFLLHFLSSPAFSTFLQDASHGTAQANVSPKVIKEVPFALPPLEEQQRIVAVLDEAFEGLTRARAHAEANLQNARELFESWAANAFNLDGARDVASTDLTIRDVCTIQSGAGFPKKHQGNSKGDFPFYKVSDMNLEGNEWELFKAINYVSDGTRSELGARVFPIGSIVFPKVGGAILTNKKRVVSVAGCVDNNVMGLIPDQQAIVPEYLHEWLRATDIYEFSNKANPPSITQATVSSWPIRLPDRDEQERVVGEAVDLRARTNNLIGAYTAALGNLNDLRQSLLQKAFAGELT